MSDTTRMLDDTLDRLLARRLADPAAWAAPDLSARLADELREAGIPLVLVSAEEGGFGGTLADAAAVAWRCGWHAAPVPIADMLLPDDDPPASGDATRGSLLTAAAMTGAMARTLDIATEYAATRVQFGRPLSKFQVVQHRLAEAASELALTEAVLAAALEAEEESGGSELLALSAKAQAGRAATFVAAAAHQTLGAVGFTQEHPLHRFTRLLWQWRDERGRQVDCEAAIGRAACAAPAGLWTYVTEKKEIRA